MLTLLLSCASWSCEALRAGERGKAMDEADEGVDGDDVGCSEGDEGEVDE